ncbi:MAG: TraX family protein [Erysipelotrichaceae bacterium]|nr:TraX family protein [Erysipelotrichaceae bacterium]
METNKGISSFILHIIAMLCMFLDHLWGTLLPDRYILTCIGRLAFPIFAFLIVEGYFHTSDIKKYLLRLFVTAVISEIPFNLMVSGSIFYPYHQNVLWGFILAILLMCLLDKLKEKLHKRLMDLLYVVFFFGGILIGAFLLYDYNIIAIPTVLTFYFFHERKWWSLLCTIIMLYYLNVYLLGGYYYPINIFGFYFELDEQSLALLSLIPIYLYKGEQGYHSKWFTYFSYLFYPVHMLILYLLMHIL